MKSRVFGYFSNLKNHKRRTLLILIPLIILLFIFWPRPPKPIETATVKKGNIEESITATGTVNADYVNLTFLAGGKLAYVGVKQGSNVRAGQTIASLDQQSVQKNLEIQLRAYAKQRETFDQTNQANNNHTPQDALNDSMKRILQDNQYDLENAVASVELQDLARQQSILTTPISGTVTKADATIVGINIPATTTYTVANFSKSTLDIDIDEADIGKVSVGQPVKITLDAYPDQSFTAIVTSIDFASHTTSTGGTAYTVEAALPNNRDFVYRLGMSADAEIITNEKNNVLLMPLSSVTDDNYVYVKSSKNTYEKRKVKLGLQNDTDTEVIFGLQEGDIVALDPTEAKKLVKK